MQKTQDNTEKKSILDLKKSSLIKAGILAAVLLILTGLAVKEEGVHGYFLPLALVLTAAAVMIVLWRVQFGRILSVLSILVVPFAAYCCLEFFTHVPWDISVLMTLMNGIFVYLFFLALSFLLGSFKWGYRISAVLLMIIGLSNYFVVEFRSSPIVPWDLLSMGTAASVADNYTYTISWRLVFVIFGFLYLLLICSKNTLRIKIWKVRIPCFAAALILLIGSITAIQEKSVKDLFGMDQTLFTPNVRYRNNGFLAAFLGNLYLINIQVPDGYSVAKVEEIEAGITASETETAETETTETEATETKTTETEKTETEASLAGVSGKTTQTQTGADSASSAYPNIIVLMNEAFSDLSVLGDFNTNEDYMPFFHSLMEDDSVSSGHLMVSVKGGNTANTEYEFLSGDSMAFLPAGSVVYQQYIHGEVPALPSYLKSLGYSTTAIHPYLATGWNRNVVYPELGFDEFLDIDSFEDPEYIRNYVSDQSAYDKVIESFESRQPGEKKFIFEVTMQNHSGYSKDYPGFEPTIWLTDFDVTSTSIQAAEKYLTLIQASDSAFEQLTKYFETVEEPTVIVMFGDHQPSDYITNVISRITGYNAEESLEENQKSYLVPYVVWSNYGLKLDDGLELTSVNYLGADLLKSAGMPLTEYQEFLLSLQKELPVICAGTYIDTEGNYHSYSETDDVFGPLLNDYNILAYNHLTDSKNRVETLFENFG